VSIQLENISGIANSGDSGAAVELLNHGPIPTNLIANKAIVPALTSQSMVADVIQPNLAHVNVDLDVNVTKSAEGVHVNQSAVNVNVNQSTVEVNEDQSAVNVNQSGSSVLTGLPAIQRALDSDIEETGDIAEIVTGNKGLNLLPS